LLKREAVCRKKSAWLDLFRSFKGCRCTIQRLSQHVKLLRGSRRVFGVKGIIYSGNDNRCITGIFTGSVNCVLVPGAIGQTGRGDEIRFRVAELCIELSRIVSRAQLTVMDLLSSLSKA